MSEVFLFEGFRLDRRGGGLFRRGEDGAFTAVAISSRALDILGLLRRSVLCQELLDAGFRLGQRRAGLPLRDEIAIPEQLRELL